VCGSEVWDPAWNLIELAISEWANLQPVIYIRFVMGPTDGSLQYCGWNIDDLEIFGHDCHIPGCCAQRGDIDHNGTIEPDIADLVYLVTYMFQNGPAPLCDDPYEPECPDNYFVESDIDGNGTCSPDIADLVYLVTYMFQDGPALVPCP